MFGKRSKVEEKPGCAQQHRSWHSWKIVFSSNTSVWKDESILEFWEFLWWPESFLIDICLFSLYLKKTPKKDFFFFLKLSSFGCLQPCFLPYSKGSLTPCDILTRLLRLLTFTSGVAFSIVSVASQSLTSVFPCKGFSKVEVWVLEPRLLWPRQLYVYCTFSNCLSFEKITSGFRCWEWPKFF